MPRGPSKHSKRLAVTNHFILKMYESFNQRKIEEDDSLVDHMRGKPIQESQISYGLEESLASQTYEGPIYSSFDQESGDEEEEDSYVSLEVNSDFINSRSSSQLESESESEYKADEMFSIIDDRELCDELIKQWREILQENQVEEDVFSDGPESNYQRLWDNEEDNYVSDEIDFYHINIGGSSSQSESESESEYEDDNSLGDHMRLLFAPESNLLRSIAGDDGYFDKQDFIDA